MAEYRNARRRADGSLEHRTVDQIMADALAEEDFKKLPGRGKPLDLEGYATADPTQRVANKLLKDNKVIPQPLQDRKEAEDFNRAADALFAREEPTLIQLHQKALEAAKPVLSRLGDQQTVLHLLAWSSLPQILPQPGAGSLPALRPWLRAGADWQRAVAAYNGRVEVMVSTGLDLLKKARERTQRLNLQMSLTRELAPQMQLKTVDIETWETQVRKAFPALPILPADLEDRLRDFHRQHNKTLWSRLRR